MIDRLAEVTFDDGSVADITFSEPSTLMEHAKNFSFSGFIGMGGETRFGDLEAITEDVFLGHPVFAQSQVSAVNDFSTNLLKTAATIPDMWASGEMNYTSLMADSHMLVNKLGVSETIKEYSRALKNEIDLNMSEFSKSGGSELEQSIYEITQGEMSLLTSVGLSVLGTGGSSVAAALFGAIQKADTWNKAIDKGISEENAGITSDLTFMTESGLGFLGNLVWFKGLKGTKTLARIAMKIGSEMLQEASQTGASMGIERLFGVDNPTGQEILQEMGKSALLAAITSGPISAVHTSLENKGIIGDMRRVGFTDNQIDKIVANLHTTGISEIKASLDEMFPEATAAILEGKKTNEMGAYVFPDVDAYSDEVDSIADVMPTINKEQVNGTIEPAIITELKTLTEKINDYNSRGEQVPDSLTKRLNEVQSNLESLVGLEQGKNLTKKQVSELTKTINGEKKYTERQAQRIAYKRLQTATLTAFKAGKKELGKIKSEIIEAVKSLPKEVQGEFLNAIDKAKTENDVARSIDRVNRKADEVYKKEAQSYINNKLKQLINSQSIPVETRRELKSIQDAIDFKKITKSKLRKLINLRNDVEQRYRNGEDVRLSRELYDAMIRLNSVYVGQLTAEELDTIVKDINLLADAGRHNIKNTNDLRSFYASNIAKQLAIDVKPIVQKQISTKYGNDKSITKLAVDSFSKLWNMSVAYDIATQPMPFFFDRLDGGKNYNGAHSRLLYKPVNEKFSQYLSLREEWMGEVIDIVQKNGYSKAELERIGLYAILQQEGGRDIAETMLSEGQFNLEFLNSAESLSDKELELYTAMRKSFDDMFPYIENTLSDVYNKPLGKVKNYFTFSVDFSQLNNVDVQDIFDTVFKGTPSKNYIPPFSKERKSKRVPLKLNALDIYTNYADRAAYLHTVGSILPTLSDAINNDEYANAAGSYTQKLVADWISLLARKGGDKYSQSFNDFQYKVLSKLRSSTAFMVMGYKITSALIQPTAIFNGAAYIGQYAFKGMNELLEENSRRFILSAIPKLKNRIGDDVSFYEFSQSKVGEAGMYVLKHLDGITAAGVAMGAYMKYADDNGIDMYNMSDEQMKAATEYAERIATLSQSSPYMIDAAPIVTQHGILGKMFSQFQSFSFSAWNTIRHHGAVYGIGEGDYGKFANILLMMLIGILAPSVVRSGYNAVIDSFMDYDSPYDDDFIAEAVSQVASTVPILSPFVSMTRYGSVPIPAINMVSKFAKIARQRNSGKKYLRLSAYLLGLLNAPTAQIDEFLRRM